MTIGEPPPARSAPNGPAPADSAREALPSFERRARRGARLIVGGFALSIVVAALGLWGLGVLAFG